MPGAARALSRPAASGTMFLEEVRISKIGRIRRASRVPAALARVSTANHALTHCSLPDFNVSLIPHLPSVDNFSSMKSRRRKVPTNPAYSRNDITDQTARTTGQADAGRGARRKERGEPRAHGSLSQHFVPAIRGRRRSPNRGTGILRDLNLARSSPPSPRAELYNLKPYFYAPLTTSIRSRTATRSCATSRGALFASLKPFGTDARHEGTAHDGKAVQLSVSEGTGFFWGLRRPIVRPGQSPPGSGFHRGAVPRPAGDA